MAAFNVFVEGAIDDSPSGLPELAEAMSQRYGLPATELVARLKRGRFRVKSNVDSATADRYKTDLEAIGARVLIEDSKLSPTATPVAGVPVQRPSGLSLPPVNRGQSTTPPAGVNRGSTTTPPSGLSAAGPQHPRPSTPIPTSGLSAAGPQHPRPSTPIPVSGLSAASGGPAATQSALGALGNDGMLSLASLDGQDATAGNQFDAPRADLPPEEKPVVKIAARPKSPSAAPKPKVIPSKAMDLFAPPDAADEEDFKVDFAADEIEDRAKKKATAPPETVPVTHSQPQSILPGHRSPTAAQSEAPVDKPRKQFERGSFILGVLAAVAIGFIPTHFVAKMREASAFEVIDRKVASIHAAADSMDTYMALDGAREKLLEEKQDKRQMIGLTSMLMWAVIAVVIGTALTKKPWER